VARGEKGPPYEDGGDAPVRAAGREGGREGRREAPPAGSSVMAVRLGERGYGLTWLKEEKDQHTRTEEMPR